MKQTDRLLRHLRDEGAISPQVAMQEYGIMRLAARIHTLKKQGYDIASEHVTDQNRYGEKVTYCMYKLDGVEA